MQSLHDLACAVSVSSYETVYTIKFNALVAL